jgi:hypothetical protein
LRIGLCFTLIAAACALAAAPGRAALPDEPVWGFVTTGGAYNEEIEAAMAADPNYDGPGRGDNFGPAGVIWDHIYGITPAITLLGFPGYPWSVCQPEDPGDGPDVYDWSACDAAWERAPKPPNIKARVMYFFLDTPNWLEYGTPRYWEKCEKYFEAMARHVNQLGCHYYIFENEPNGMMKPNGQEWDEYYFQRIKHVGAGIHRAGPDNYVIGGNLMSYSVGAMRKLYDRGIKDYIDIVGYHPYAGIPDEGIAIDDCARMHELMVEFGDGHKKLYFGEGWAGGRHGNRGGPTIPYDASEIEGFRRGLVNGLQQMMTKTDTWDPAWLFGATFFIGNDFWECGDWRRRAKPLKDGAGQVTAYEVDTYWVWLDIAPRFSLGGLVDFYGNSKDSMLHLFPGNRLVLLNPGFELAGDPPDANVAYSWEVIGDKSALSLASDVRRGGARSQRIQLDAFANLALRQLSQPVSVTPGQAYAGSVWYQADQAVLGMVGGIGIKLNFFDGSGNPVPTVGPPAIAIDKKVEPGWQRLRVTADAPEGASRMSLTCAVSDCSGIIYFDDAAIAPADRIDRPGIVSGYVLDRYHKPLDGAVVRTTTGGFEAITDAKGFYRIPDVPAGVYEVIARHPGRVPTRAIDQLVEPGMESSVSFNLDKNPGGLTIERVAAPATVPADGAPAEVAVTVANHREHPVIITGADVYFERGGRDVSTEYLVAANPANPDRIERGEAVTLRFQVTPREGASTAATEVMAYVVGDEDTPNLLALGDFEHDTKIPDDNWEIYSEGGDPIYAIETENPHGGRNCARISIHDLGGNKWNRINLSLDRLVPIKENTNYVFGCWHRIIVDRGDAEIGITLEELKADGIRNGWRMFPVAWSSEWRRDECTYLTWNKTTQGRIWLYIWTKKDHSTIDTWWDDLYLKEMGATVAADQPEKPAVWRVKR